MGSGPARPGGSLSRCRLGAGPDGRSARICVRAANLAGVPLTAQQDARGRDADPCGHADERHVGDEGIDPAGHRPTRPAESLLTGPAGIR